MSGVTETTGEDLLFGIAALIGFGAYAVFQGGRLLVKGIGTVAHYTVEGAKELARKLAEERRRQAEAAERRRVERLQKQEEERLATLATQKNIAIERIENIIEQSRSSKDNVINLIAVSQEELAETLQRVRQADEISLGGLGKFNCEPSLKKIDKLQATLNKVKERVQNDDTEARLSNVRQAIGNSDDVKDVQAQASKLSGNERLTVELQIAIAEVRVEREALSDAIKNLAMLQKDLAAIQLELSLDNVTELNQLKRIVANTDVSDSESVANAYSACSEIFTQLTLSQSAAQNARLMALLRKNITAIQDRLNSINKTSRTVANVESHEEFYNKLAEAENYFAVLSNGKAKYKQGEIKDKMSAIRRLAKQGDNLAEMDRLVRWMKDCSVEYDEFCGRYEEYLEALETCNEFANSLGYKSERDNFSVDKKEGERQITRLRALTEKYKSELKLHRREMLIARGVTEFFDKEYSCISDVELNDAVGTKQLIFAKKGEAGVAHVVQANLEGKVVTYTTGISAEKEGKVLNTAGSDYVISSCAKMRKNHEEFVKHFESELGEKLCATVGDIDPNSPVARKLPPIVLKNELLEAYLEATGCRLELRDGQPILVSVENQADSKTVHGSPSVHIGKTTVHQNKGGKSLAIDPNKK